MHAAGAVEGLVRPPQDGVGAPVVDVLDHARDLGALLAELGHEGLEVGEVGPVGHDDEKHLVARVAKADHGVPQHAFAAVLVVGAHVMMLGRTGDRVEHATSARILDEAALAGDDVMCAHGVEAAPDAPALARREGRRGLETICDGVVDAADRLHDGTVLLGRPAEKLLDEGLLAFELDGVGHGEPFAAAAGAGDRARIGAVSHGTPFVSS